MSKKLTFNLVVADAVAALGFYEKVFDGVRGEVFEFTGVKGNNEANVDVGGVSLRLIDENLAYECFPPKQGEVDSIWLQLVVDDVEATLEKAKEHGATVEQEIDEFMGTRHAQITDPFNYVWTINQIMEEISYQERFDIYKGMLEE